uniref:F-actin monooxygenase n=1 Tax=Ciona savignyi TaxID=51511 RepID=H2ZHW2_CIOSA
MFNSFIQAQTCIQVFSTFHELCTAIRLDYPPPHCSTAQTSFYPRLKAALSSHWKAKSLFDKLDKRFLSKEYFADQRSHKAGGFRAAQDLKVKMGTRNSFSQMLAFSLKYTGMSQVLIIGAGPCGLRTAIEMACLGAKTVVLEKRDNFSRNNVLHLWPYIITDLKTLGAKKIYGQFCSGAIDHISIRQLQLILLKLTLLLGVEIIVNVSFEGLCPPTSSQVFADGWTARVIPDNHTISNYEFDVVVGADGKRNTLQGFTRKEFRGKLAIGLTVNFINRRTTAEAKVEEISGVAYIFNQHFFKDLQSSTGIDLENIVYYKGDTHYFVMTAKKHSLISKGVLKQDSENTNELLCYSNIDQKALMQYAREAADFSTNHQLPDLEFAINQFAQPDIALFDFTCMYAAENAALFREVNGQKLLSCLVGDSLLEPFWPMGTGCARGFFAAFDLVWMTRQLAMKRRNSNNSVELSVLAERESIYRVLHQTTPSNTMKKHQNYTIDPNTRYVNLNLKAVHVDQVKTLYLTDREVATPTDPDDATPMVVDQPEPSTDVQLSMIRPILSWCQSTTKGYAGVDVQDLTSSWKSGLALCALVHRFRPDLIQWAELDYMDVEANNQLAFDVAEQNLGISPVMTGKEMANCSEVDRLVMLTYISQFYEVFKNETPSNPGGVSSPIGIINRFTSRFKRSLHEPDKKKKFNKPFSKKKSETSHKITGQKENKENKQRCKFSPKPSSDRCYFCKQRVYIVERLSFEGFFFHRHCFVCSHCGTTLRRSGYEFDSESG